MADVSIADRFSPLNLQIRNRTETWYYLDDRRAIHVFAAGGKYLLREDAGGKDHEPIIASFDDLETALAAYLLLPDEEYKAHESDAIDEREAP